MDDKVSRFLEGGPAIPVDCGYYVCDQRTHYCAESSPGLSHTKECFSCSDVCNWSIPDEKMNKMCLERCPSEIIVINNNNNNIIYYLARMWYASNLHFI